MAKANTIAAASGGGRLAGKIAVVTGAAGNIGGYIVRHYLAEGATVVMTGRTPERTDAAAEAIRTETGVDSGRLATVALDGGDPESVRVAIADVVKRFGRIDILVNNAGSAGPKQPIEQLPINSAELAALQKTGSTEERCAKYQTLEGREYSQTKVHLVALKFKARRKLKLNSTRLTTWKIPHSRLNSKKAF